MGQELLVRILAGVVGAVIVLPLTGLWIAWLVRRFGRSVGSRRGRP